MNLYFITLLSDNVKDYKNDKEFDNISLVEKDLIPLIPDKVNCANLLAIKSESGINVEYMMGNDLKNKEHKKIKIEVLKSDPQSKNLCPLSYSNKSYIISKNNTPYLRII